MKTEITKQDVYSVLEKLNNEKIKIKTSNDLINYAMINYIPDPATNLELIIEKLIYKYILQKM